jgi:hypothetical protein
MAQYYAIRVYKRKAQVNGTRVHSYQVDYAYVYVYPYLSDAYYGIRQEVAVLCMHTGIAHQNIGVTT